jgi:hypothetical protein
MNLMQKPIRRLSIDDFDKNQKDFIVFIRTRAWKEGHKLQSLSLIREVINNTLERIVEEANAVINKESKLSKSKRDTFTAYAAFLTVDNILKYDSITKRFSINLEKEESSLPDKT